MGKYSGISWTDHTFNPWWGCFKVSAGCRSCYAKTLADRFNPGLWEKDGKRRMFPFKHWDQLRAWNNEKWVSCKECGWRGPVKKAKINLFGEPNCPKCDAGWVLQPYKPLVFVGSMCDVFEDNPHVETARRKLWEFIDFATPNLIKILLTKRPENILSMIPESWFDNIPTGLWLGISAENQENFDSRWPVLESVGRQLQPEVIFISAEPMIGSIDMQPWLVDGGMWDDDPPNRLPDWVIIGAESGNEMRRPMYNYMALSLVNQCREAGVSVFVKQINAPNGDLVKDVAQFPQELQIQEFPDVPNR